MMNFEVVVLFRYDYYFQPQYYSNKHFFICLQYFVSFLRRHRGNPEPSRQYVEWCLDNCNHVHTATRKNPPSTVEITVKLILLSLKTLDNM